MSVGLAGSHGRAAVRALRPVRMSPWLPPLAAALTAVVGVANIASTLTPGVAERVRLLHSYEPVETIPLAHALVLPIGVSLLILAFYLGKRRRGAWTLALVVLVTLGLLNLVKGLDVEETGLSWGLAAFLVVRRDAFFVRHDRMALRAALWRIPLLVLGATGTALVAVWVASDSVASHVTWRRAWEEALDLLTFSGGSLHAGSLHYHHALRWVPTAVEMVSVLTLVIAFFLLLRPIKVPRHLPGSGARRLARQLVERHGSDTLSYFKLRQDKQYLFSRDGRAFLGYAIERRHLLVSSDPVGPPDAIPGLMSDLFAFAEERGLKVGVINGSESLAALGRTAGMRSLYFGDEAILDLGDFSLDGRRIRKVRQSVSRLVKAGYTAELTRLGDLDRAQTRELAAVSERWRHGEAEKGFSMCMDHVCGEHQSDSAVVLARDGTGAIRGFMHLVPAYGRSAMSLSAMRRERDTPNGLMEFLVVRTVELLRSEGVDELSLNFAVFARWMHAPRNRWERALGRACRPLNPFFQIESLYRFNAKFFPRWEPRYLLYQGRLGLLPFCVAALGVEGRLPRSRVGTVPAAPARAESPAARAA